ncbi:MAG: N-acetyltransferase [Bacteroidota bacterium]
MNIVDVRTGKKHLVEILPVEKDDYKKITKSIFWLNWKEEQDFSVYKLQRKGSNELLGLISLENFDAESRVEIRLLAVSKNNRGKSKEYANIAGNLIAFACIESLKLYGEMACVSLVPKTELVAHYIEKYDMLQAGRSLFLEGIELIRLITKYDGRD